MKFPFAAKFMRNLSYLMPQRKPKTTIVYRVEHPIDSLGPYTSMYAIEEFSKHHNDREFHPTPIYDEGLSKYSDNVHDLMRYLGYEYSCFSSLDQLKEWFDTDDRKLLAEDGFNIIIFEVPIDDVIFGSKQGLMDKARAHAIDYILPENV
jgi:hypothetical protein